MSQHQKLLQRLLKKPKDFTWSELICLLNGFGYTEVPTGKTAGSRRRFVHPEREPIILHKPHPGNELKSYQVTQVITYLKVEGIA
jgi:predicted RNA binding protein YcfA (HicA-like mRNA interferase family)